MTARFLQLAAWLTLFKWTGRVLLVALGLIVLLFSGFLVAGLMRGQTWGDALLTAFIATVILITAPFRWLAKGQLPSLDP